MARHRFCPTTETTTCTGRARHAGATAAAARAARRRQRRARSGRADGLESQDADDSDFGRTHHRSDSVAHDRSEARELFARLGSLPEHSPGRAEVRDNLVEMHLPLVEHLARRFRNRGEPLDDLIQVATIGLIKSVDRFDPERGVEFSTYATPTIVGEIKRHFRDKGWAVRVPRRLQELQLALTTATSELAQQQRPRADRRRARRAPRARARRRCSRAWSRPTPTARSRSTRPTPATTTPPRWPTRSGDEDDALEGVEYRESLKPLLEQLPPREKRILMLRFFGNMTQSQIAAELGISQMHVSRLLAAPWPSSARACSSRSNRPHGPDVRPPAGPRRLSRHAGRPLAALSSRVEA